jgi:Na+-transporting methylmalonyl-CoA/oxaloacetate decarboxylase gamma subunit
MGLDALDLVAIGIGVVMLVLAMLMLYLVRLVSRRRLAPP